MAEINPEIGKAIARDVADFLFSKSQDNIVSMEISDTGALLLSGEITEEAGEIAIEYSAPYASAVNDGTKPHFVSSKDLEKWVRRKLGVPIKDVPKVAKAIANKIKKFGTLPKPFFDNAIEVTKVKYKGQVDLRRT